MTFMSHVDVNDEGKECVFDWYVYYGLQYI